jgi:hypothetical protein
MGRRLSTAIVVLLGGTGLAVLVLVRAPVSTPSAASQYPTIESAAGGIPRGSVDSTSPTYEGQDTDQWDALHPSERMARAERAITAALGDGTHSEARERAWMDLSIARADFFASDAGTRRYLELEESLRAAGDPPGG